MEEEEEDHVEAVELSAGEEYHELLLLLFVDDQELSAGLLVSLSPEFQELQEFDHDEVVVVVVAAAAGFALLALLP